MKDEEKKNPEAEADKKPEEPAGTEPAEETKSETPPAEEKPADTPTDASQSAENGEGAKPESEENPTDKTDGGPAASAPDARPALVEEDMSEELMLARAELAAIKSGMDISVAEDAVILAMHALKKDGGTPDQDGLEKALKGVLKRHPEWDARKKQQDVPVGFKVGADGSKNQDSASDDTISRAFGNK